MGERRHGTVVVRAIVAVAVLATTVAVVGGAGGAVTPVIASDAPVVAPGTAPRPCTEADAVWGATGQNVVNGRYWSEEKQDWVATPYCFPVWGYLAMSPPSVIEGGNAVTMTAIPKDGSNIAGFIPIWGGMSWSVPGTPLSGCTSFDLTCTVVLGTQGVVPTEWNWQQFLVSGPTAFVTWLPQFGCTEETPCPYTTTYAWSFVAIRPSTAKPTADFTYAVDGGTVSFSATSTDPEDLPLFHEWDFGDGTAGVGANPAHTYTSGGSFDVTLTSTNTVDRSDAITKTVEVVAEPLAITDLVVDPASPVAGEPASVRVELTNEGADPVLGILPTIGVTPEDVLAVAGTPESGFDLPPGASRMLEVPLDARRGGDAWVSASATGVVDGDPTAARLRTLAVKVRGPALEATLDTPDERPRQGEAFEVSMTVVNLDADPVTGVAPTLTAEPADRVEVVGPSPSGPVELAPSGEPGDRATFTWTLTADRTAKVALVAEAAGLASDGDPVAATIEASVDLDADLTFDWEIEARYKGDLDAVTLPELVTPLNYRFRATIQTVNGRSCDATDTFVFQADGEALPVTRIPGTCLFDFTRPTVDPFDLEAARVVDEVIDSIGEERVEARDFMIVSIGDSLSSGEGNPRPSTPIWTDRQCHRSAAAGPADAARRIEESDPHSVVTFVHLACSGANTPVGLTGQFGGMEPGPVIRPQIPEIARFADGREIDAVVMSVGANDLEFGKVVVQCFMSWTDCFNQTIADGVNQVPVPEFISSRVAQLPMWHSRNRTWLEASGVDPGRVYLLDYPNATRNHNGDPCSALSWTLLFTEAEWLWAEARILLPLNAATSAAAAAHGYRAVTGFGPLFERHGYCSSEPWITSVVESALGEYRSAGAFHPNRSGHERYAERIFESLRADLFVDGKPRPATDTGEGPTRLDGAAEPGDVRVEIRGDRFTIGDRVVIDPGTGTAEVRTIVDKGSLVFDAPLEHFHPSGTLIVLEGELPGALDHVAPAAEPQPPGSPTGPTPELASGGETVTPVTEVVPGTLPATGADVWRLVTVAVALMLTGWMLAVTRRRSDRSAPISH